MWNLHEFFFSFLKEEKEEENRYAFIVEIKRTK
jgi:hypothetical protein